MAQFGHDPKLEARWTGETTHTLAAAYQRNLLPHIVNSNRAVTMQRPSTREETPCHGPNNSKKARYMSSWECSFAEGDTSTAPRFGLVDLFGKRSRSHVGKKLSSLSLEVNNQKEKEEPSFFTFSMEHREGGTVAQHQGEERILVFRSDQRGAIAKIIYSSNVTSMQSFHHHTKVPLEVTNKDTKIGQEDVTTPTIVQAKVHALSVKEAYRGFDLGSLLFMEAMVSLKERYNLESSCINPTNDLVQLNGVITQSVVCELDAEEDIRRYNKLVSFYERLGCQIKPNVKICYINNNDGETYRKVPMQITLRPRTYIHHRKDGMKETNNCSLVDRQEGFLPVLLRESCGKRARLSAGPASSSMSPVDWLVVETPDGFLEFHTTKGLVLTADPDGNCKTAADDQACPADWSRFQLFRVSDSSQQVLCGVDDEEVDDESTPYEARQKELWMLRSIHGSFLSLNRDNHNLQCSKGLAFWQTDEHSFGLTCTYDTPPRRQHFRQMWSKQTVQYVRSMRKRYCSFELQKMKIKQALDLIRFFPSDPFSVDLSPLSPSLRTLCVSL